MRKERFSKTLISIWLLCLCLFLLSFVHIHRAWKTQREQLLISLGKKTYNIAYAENICVGNLAYTFEETEDAGYRLTVTSHIALTLGNKDVDARLTSNVLFNSFLQLGGSSHTLRLANLRILASTSGINDISFTIDALQGARELFSEKGRFQGPIELQKIDHKTFFLKKALPVLPAAQLQGEQVLQGVTLQEASEMLCKQNRIVVPTQIFPAFETYFGTIKKLL